MKKIFNFQSLIFNTKRQQGGFTLIELLVTISIIGILSSFLLANFVGIRQRARDGVRKSDLRQIQSALELYRSDIGSYPYTDISPCGSSISGGSPAVTYMKKIPCDPSNTVPSTSYQYKSASGTNYCLRTCLENVNDNERDEVKNPSTPECDDLSLLACSSGKSYTLQNP